MVKKFVTSNIIDNLIDNLTFYIYGRLERELEGMAERTGLPKSDFANRLSTLLSNAEGGPVLGMLDQVPTVPENPAPGVHVGKPALALGERSPSSGVHQDKSGPSEVSARRKVAIEILEASESPIFCGDLHRQMRTNGKMSYAEAHTATARMVHGGFLVKQGMGPMAKFTWTKESLRGASSNSKSEKQQDDGEAGDSQPTKKQPSLPKGEPSRLVLKFIQGKGKNLTQKEICQKMKNKYPQTTSMVWNGSITNLVRMKQLQRGANGGITIA